MAGIVEILGGGRPGLLKFFRTTMGIGAIAVLVVFGSIGYNAGSGYDLYMLLAIPVGGMYLLFRRAIPYSDARARARKRWKAYGPKVERVPYTRFEVYRDRYATATRAPPSEAALPARWGAAEEGPMR